MELRFSARLSRWLRLAATVIGIVSALVGAGHLAAWLGGYLAHRGAAALVMKTNTAVCLLGSGVAIVLIIPPDSGTARQWVVRALGFLVLALGLLTLSENLIGWNVGIDQLLAREASGAIGVASPNRMGIPAAVCFALFGPALLLSAGRNRKWLRLAQGLALGVSLIALLGTIGFFYGAQPLYSLAGLTAIAWPTAGSLLALGLGFLCAFPTEGFMAQVTADDSGGISVRRLFPILLMPIGLGWLRLAGERWGWFDAATGTALMMVAFMVVLAVLTYAVGRRVSRAATVERQQRDSLGQANAELQTANTSLEQSRRTAFNLRDEAVAARQQAERAIEELRKEVAERKRAEETSRESEERYRTLFDTLIEGFCTIEMMFDADGRPVDYRFLEINPAFEKQTGLHDAQGKLMRDLAPDHEAHWFEIYGRIALTGEPARFENEAKALGRYYEVCAFRIGGPESRKVAILFNDITERRRAEEEMRRRAEELRAANQELVRFNQAMVGRELRMIELKKEVNALCTELRQPPRYQR